VRHSIVVAIFVTSAASGANAQTPTFAKDVAPIFYANCI